MSLQTVVLNSSLSSEHRHFLTLIQLAKLSSWLLLLFQVAGDYTTYEALAKLIT